jgi:hypothetical protein
MHVLILFIPLEITCKRNRLHPSDKEGFMIFAMTNKILSKIIVDIGN